MNQLHCPNCGEVVSADQAICPHCQFELKNFKAADNQLGNDPMNPVPPSTTSQGGPLSELENIIPIEPIVNRATKPKPYSVKVQVTPDQLKNIHLLDDLRQDTTEARRNRKPITRSYQWLVRLVIMLALFLVISTPILFDIPNLPPPTADPRASKFSQRILSLPNNATVLLAFDYQPGYAAELDTSTMVILDQLMARNAFLTLVSTSPSGVAQAERTLRLVTEQTGRRYESPINYVNLGYLPGGSTGLNSLATALQTTTPRSVSGNQIWNVPGLKNINSISDFNLVIVVTDDANIARTWIEQVKPLLVNTPLLMVVSAQVEPMIQPYYEAIPSQIDELIVGIMGSASYETFSGRIDNASNLWSAYSLSIMAAAGLILIGSVISTIVAAAEQEKKDPRES